MNMALSLQTCSPQTCHPRESAQLSGENHEIRKQWHFHLKAIISAPLSVIPAPLSVIPAPLSVIPAKAGTQGPMPHIAGVTAFPSTKILPVALGPRLRGGDNGGRGGDKRGVGSKNFEEKSMSKLSIEGNIS